MNRWYDKNEKLRTYIESLHDIDPELRNHIVHDLMDLVKEHNPALLDSFVEEYPLETRNQRWYDEDPYLWILLNGLKFADDAIILKVIDYFEEL
ncbi:MAG: hypothetical protein JW904_14010 [Spirochaetales bacterium]|nr:hypothetical protein [Spirochaetales bacterium]